MSDSSPHTIRHNECAAAQRPERGARCSVWKVRTCSWLGAALFILVSSAGALSMPLSEYRERVRQSAAELESVARSGQHEIAQLHAERVNKALGDLQRAVPQDETVEWEGEKFHVNNRWIDEEVKNFRQLPLYDQRGPVVLERIIARLRAIEDRLKELDPRAAEATAQTPANKDQEKEQLKKILARAEFNPKPPEKGIWQRIWDKLKEWWNSLFGGISMGNGQGSWFSFIAMVVIFSLAGAVLAYAIWKLVLLLQGRKRKRKTNEREARVILGERLAPDQKASDILAEAEALARKGELRAAIRKAYIALLCELGDRKVITLAQHKTNRDYLRSVRERRPLLNEMQKLTNSFENHWYGFRQTTADDWTAFRKGYDKVLSTE